MMQHYYRSVIPGSLFLNQSDGKNSSAKGRDPPLFSLAYIKTRDVLKSIKWIEAKISPFQKFFFLLLSPLLPLLVLPIRETPALSCGLANVTRAQYQESSE